MRKTQIGVISLIAVLLLVAFTCTVFADTGVPAVPEGQSLITGTSSDVVGTVTETDAGAWTLTKDPARSTQYTALEDFDLYYVPEFDQGLLDQLVSLGGSFELGPGNVATQLTIPDSAYNVPLVGFTPLFGVAYTWGDVANFLNLPSNSDLLSSIAVLDPGIHSGVLNPGQVQYTAGYNDQYSGVSGQQTFAKSMALSTTNKIADQSNIKANTNIQFIAVDTGRATRTEDLLLDGAAQAQDSSGLILCPFANANPGIIPAFCNIEQAGSAFDTTLTSTVTSADTRFVGTDATIPVVLNYNINAQGINLGSQSSPMIGSVSAYLKVHVQEARNQSTATVTLPANEETGNPGNIYFYALPPTKSEDLAYSETSTASGQISGFIKSMSYSSQASAVPFSVPDPITLSDGENGAV
jgi:hypothetical protein